MICNPNVPQAGHAGGARLMDSMVNSITGTRERLPYKQEVSGSTPLAPTTESTTCVKNNGSENLPDAKSRSSSATQKRPKVKLRSTRQSGSVTERNGKWRGRFRVYSERGVFMKNIALGSVSSMSKEEAALRLIGIIHRSEGKRVRHEVKPSELMVPPPPDGSSLAPTRGVVAELLVAADLQSKGYEVFIPVSPIAPCDLLAMDSAWNVVRVQVKKSSTSPTGAIRCDIRKDIGRFDLLAALVDNKRIEYRNACDIASAEYPFKEAQPTRGRRATPTGEVRI